MFKDDMGRKCACLPNQTVNNEKNGKKDRERRENSLDSSLKKR